MSLRVGRLLMLGLAATLVVAPLVVADVTVTFSDVGKGDAIWVHDCLGNIYNCSDFDTHAEAQTCFEYCLTVVGYDIHRLDGDHDGDASESPP